MIKIIRRLLKNWKTCRLKCKKIIKKMLKIKKCMEDSKIILFMIKNYKYKMTFKRIIIKRMGQIQFRDLNYMKINFKYF